MRRSWAQFGHKPHPQLLDHLVRPCQERRRDREAKRLRRLEVDHQLELGGLLDGEVCRLRASEDPVDISGCTTEIVRDAYAIRYEAPVFHKPSPSVHGGQAARCGEIDNPSSMDSFEGSSNYKERTNSFPRHRGEGGLEIVLTPNPCQPQPHAQGPPRSLQFLQGE